MNPAESSTELTLAQPTGEVSAEMLATLAEIGDPVAAKRALSFALEASPDHPDARFSVGRCVGRSR